MPKRAGLKRRFGKPALVFALLWMLQSANTGAQQAGVPPSVNLGASATNQAPPATNQAPPPGTAPPAAGSTTIPLPREATWRKLPGNFVQDQKDLWLFPVKLAKGKYWLPSALVV